ncbi:hypothetical protein GCM10023319_52630 [Nocardia iowensis]
MLRQYRFDLAGLDSETADLDLIIDSPEKLQLPGVVPTHQITGAIQATTARIEGIGDEPCRGQIRPAVIPPAQLRTGHIQLARHPYRNRRQPRIQHEQPHIGQRGPDRHHRVIEVFPGLERSADRECRCLGGPVHVHDAGVGAQPQSPPEHLGRHLLAADPHLPKPGERIGAMVDEQLEQPGGEEYGGDAIRHQLPTQHCDIGAARRRDNYSATAQQRHPDLIGGGIERDRRMHQHAGVRTVAPTRLGREGHHVAVRDGNTFRDTGRARGIGHVRQILRGRRNGPIRGGFVHYVDGVEVEARCRGIGQQIGGGGIGHDHHRCGVA